MRLLFASLILLSHFIVNAQSISGRILLADGNAAEFATVKLFTVQDSTLKAGTLSGADGTYTFNDVAPGRYFIESELIGNGKATCEAFQYSDGAFKAPEIKLANTANELAEITIAARKPAIEVQADKTILNVEGSISSTGLNALELLRKAPGVTVDNNENLVVKGKNNVRIQIDGRDTPLDGKDLAALLKGMQASDIANIEIISNPSAKFDAAGNAGIINIKLKKNKALGTNGNVGFETIYGEDLKAGMNLSLNHRGEKFAAFGSYNNHYGNWHNTQYFYREQAGLVFDQEAKQYNESRWNSARIGGDWFINSKHTVGLLVNGNYDPGNWYGKGNTKISTIEAPTSVDSLLDATNNIDGNRYNVNFNLNYRFADTAGHTINIDIDHGLYRIDGQSDQPNFYRSPDRSELFSMRHYRNNTPADIDISTAKVDYETPFLKGKLGVGGKYAYVETDNTFDFFNVVNGLDEKDLNVSNRFKYLEQTTAAYFNYQGKFGKLHIQAGLRMEHTDYDGTLISENTQNGNTVKNNYTEWFPSGALTYTFNPKMGLNLTYSRRIDRPSYQDLNPFEFKLDELTYSKGNPRLRPQFTNSFELAPTYNGYPVISLGYSRTKDVFTQVLDTANYKATFITQENIADQTNYTLTVNAPTPIAKWWEGFVSITGIHSEFSAKFREGYVINQAFNTLNVFAEQTIRLPKDFSIQLSGWYNSPGFWGTLKSQAQGAMDAAVAKKLWNGKGEIKLRFGDILHTAGWGGENVGTPGLRMLARGNWESRIVAVNFSYRFGSAEIKGASQRKTGLEEEGRRVKGKN